MLGRNQNCPYIHSSVTSSTQILLPTVDLAVFMTIPSPGDLLFRPYCGSIRCQTPGRSPAVLAVTMPLVPTAAAGTPPGLVGDNSDGSEGEVAAAAKGHFGKVVVVVAASCHIVAVQVH